MPFIPGVSVYKVTFEQRDTVNCQGWTNSFYIDESNATQRAEKIIALATKLAACQAAPVRISRIVEVFTAGVRISDEYSTEDVVPGFPEVDADAPWRAIRIRLRDAVGNATTVSVKGIPDGMVSRATNKDPILPIAELKTAIEAYIAQLVTDQWRFLIVNRPPFLNPIQVVGITVDAEKSRYTLNLPGHGLVAGDEIFIMGSQVGKWPTIRGRQHIIPIDDDNVYIVASVPCDAPQFVGGLQWYKITYATTDIFKGTIKGVRRHKSGIPRGIPRGRRSNRKATDCIGCTSEPVKPATPIPPMTEGV